VQAIKTALNITSANILSNLSKASFRKLQSKSKFLESVKNSEENNFLFIFFFAL
jgi:hypothetical protein